MALFIRRKADLLNTERHITTHAYETVQFLLAEDGAGVTLTDITLKPGLREVYGHENRIEVAYCISGRARLTNITSGEVLPIEPGTMFAATANEKFYFEADEPTRMICVFNPPFSAPYSQA